MSQNNNWHSLIQERISRRGFLRGLSTVSAGAAVSATIPAGVINAINPITNTSDAAPAIAPDAQTISAVPFKAIAPGNADELILPEGFQYQVLIKRGDVFTKDGKTFGDNADWTGWYPIDGLKGGNSTTEGLLIINNEYLNPILVSGYKDPKNETVKTAEQVKAEKESVGFAVVHFKKGADGKWAIVKDSDYAKRFDATVEIALSGPVAGSTAVKGATKVIGSLANCSGGYTPWMTGLSCEENYQDYYGESSFAKPDLKAGYRWLDQAVTTEIPEHYGWVVEVDPYSGVAKKRTALGRFRHENVAIGIGKTGKVVAYMGDDKGDECVYKFVSKKAYDPANRDANLDILDEGMLYAANFGSGKWIPLVYTGNEAKLGDEKAVGYKIASQADLLTYASPCARVLGATRTDRPEDIEVHPITKDIYISFTNNSAHSNYHGQITKITEKDGDHESVDFTWEIFAVGGPQSGFSSPDNLAFDKKGNLWVVTDVSSSSLNKGIFKFMGNNAMFMIPTSGPDAGKAFRFANGPVECEMTGPTWLDDNTLIFSVQHPGEVSESLEKLTSKWPGGDVPRAAVVAVTGPFNKA